MSATAPFRFLELETLGKLEMLSKQQRGVEPTESLQRDLYVVGYFDHSNAGDEQYRITFQYLLETYLTNPENYHVSFLDCDTLKDTFIDNDAIILLGGGDVLNHYFLNSIHDKFRGRPNKILAVSVGMPYSSIVVQTDKLGIIDYIFLRTTQDIELLSAYYDPTRIFYLPDLSLFLLHKLRDPHFADHLEATQPLYIQRLDKLKRHGRSIMALSLNRHIYSTTWTSPYDTIVKHLALCVATWIKQGHFIVLLPFNTCFEVAKDMNSENDVYIHEDVLEELSMLVSASVLKSNILHIDHHMDVMDMFALYPYFDVTLPMRFHATLFSLYHNVPMLPVFTTKKIRNLLLDIDWPHFYRLPTNEKDLPIALDPDVLLQKMEHMLACSADPIRPHWWERCLQCWPKKVAETSPLDDVEHTMHRTCSSLLVQLKINAVPLMQAIEQSYPKINPLAISPKVEGVLAHLVDTLQAVAADEGVQDFRRVTRPSVQQHMIHLVSYALTNGFDSVYNYGLEAQMFKHTPNGHAYDFMTGFRWIYQDVLLKGPHIDSSPRGLFNLDYVHQCEYQEVHRSGWKYVYDGIKHLHNQDHPLLCDLSIDKTFHWRREAYVACGILPYRTPWIGVLHHTFDTRFSAHNNAVLFATPVFLESLNACQGILVFSEYLLEQVEQQLADLRVRVPVYRVAHPTETHVPMFSWTAFVQNDDPKLLHIGGWLRNVMSFYALQLPDEVAFTYRPAGHLWRENYQGTLRKLLVRGHRMNNYFPAPDLLPMLEDKLLVQPMEDKHGTAYTYPSSCCQTAASDNNWNVHFLDHVRDMYESVDACSRLENAEYDDMMTKNLVFLHLIDASTVNTVLECVARNTPLFVNRHPAIEELLGPTYPLFYEVDVAEDALPRRCTDIQFQINVQVHRLLSDGSVYRAHEHLKHLDKRCLDMAHFVQQLTAIAIDRAASLGSKQEAFERA